MADSGRVDEGGSLVLKTDAVTFVGSRYVADGRKLEQTLGLAVEDLAAAHHVYARAKEEGVGTEVDLGGMRDSHDGSSRDFRLGGALYAFLLRWLWRPFPPRAGLMCPRRPV